MPLNVNAKIVTTHVPPSVTERHSTPKACCEFRHMFHIKTSWNLKTCHQARRTRPNNRRNFKRFVDTSRARPDNRKSSNAKALFSLVLLLNRVVGRDDESREGTGNEENGIAAFAYGQLAKSLFRFFAHGFRPCHFTPTLRNSKRDRRS